MPGEDLTQSGVPQPGTLIAGKYRVGAPLAKGGMGVVCEGVHEALDQRVAIKFLLPESSSRAEIVERFLREARAAAKLHSDHVVRVFDVGSHEGAPYMVMEYLQGGDLAHRLEEGALPVDEAVEYLCQALEAIAEAHRAGIVHRDIKPANLFLARKGDSSVRVKVLDFGISKVDRGQDLNAALTSTHVMMGSPGYMSPEQVRSTKNVDARADVWSLGVVLYEALTGTIAYPGETLGDIFAKIREEQLPPVRSLRPEVSAGLEAVLSRCLQRDRELRFANGAELLAALAPFRPGRFSAVVTAEPAKPKPGPGLDVDGAPTVRELDPEAALASLPGSPARTVPEVATAISATNASWSSAPEPIERQSRRWLFAGAGAILVLLVLGVIVLSSSSEPSAEAPSVSVDRTAGSAPAAREPLPTPQPEPASAVADTPPSPAAEAPKLADPLPPSAPNAVKSPPARPASKASLASSSRPPPPPAAPPAPAKRPAAREDLGI